MTFDIAPFFRSTTGFDRLFDQLAPGFNLESRWPEFDVLKTGEDDFRIMVAVPGFQQEDLNLELKNGWLTVSGTRRQDADDSQFVHRGIGRQSFTRTFQLADFVDVRNAVLKDGVLTVDLHREVPEGLKPRQIEVSVADKETPQAIEESQQQVEQTATEGETTKAA